MTDEIAGLILAGGASRRMGGGDKFLLELAGTALIDRAIERLAPQVEKLAISANCDPALLNARDLPVIADAPPAGRGPLAGILAGMDWATAETEASHLLTVASDTPFFPDDLAEALAAAADDDIDSPVLAASSGRVHPVFGLWPLSLREPLRNWLADGRSLKVTDFADERTYRVCHFFPGESEDPFFNINTPDDLEEAERWVAKDSG